MIINQLSEYLVHLSYGDIPKEAIEKANQLASQIENTCDVCDSKLVMREDDKDEDSIRNRISTYYAITYPLIDYYKEQGKLVSIDALQDIEDIAKDIDDILGGLQ